MVAEEHRKRSLTDPAMLITQCLRGLLKVAQLKKSTAKGRKIWAGDEAGKESKRFWNHRVVALRMMRQGQVLEPIAVMLPRALDHEERRLP